MSSHIDDFTGNQPRVLPPPSRPLDVARELLPRFTLDGDRVLVRWREDWWKWTGPCWRVVPREELRSELYGLVGDAVYATEEDAKPWAPSASKIANLEDALQAITLLCDSVEQPCSLDDRDLSGGVLPMRNGLLRLSGRELLPLTPAFFNGWSLPFQFDPDAPEPVLWHRFLRELWPKDDQQISLLQELFGYWISGRTDLQKIGLMIGPPRSGKSTIARVACALLGEENCAAPTPRTLRQSFGVQSLIGKLLIQFTDVQALSRGDAAALLEELLCTSGEDHRTIQRKFRDAWHGTFPGRYLLISNKLPSFDDPSGALSSRLLPLVLVRSFAGEEDSELFAKLHGELGGIFLWALAGLDRLQRNRGRFTEPASTADVRRQLLDLASPIAAFVRDKCAVGVDEWASKDELWKAWTGWAEDANQSRGTKAEFFRDLLAAQPTLRETRPGKRPGEKRPPRGYEGIGVRDGADDGDEDEVYDAELPVCDCPPGTLTAPDGRCAACGRLRT